MTPAISTWVTSHILSVSYNTTKLQTNSCRRCDVIEVSLCCCVHIDSSKIYLDQMGVKLSMGLQVEL